MHVWRHIVLRQYLSHITLEGTVMVHERYPVARHPSGSTPSHLAFTVKATHISPADDNHISTPEDIPRIGTADPCLQKLHSALHHTYL